jgi:hypothetical protein
VNEQDGGWGPFSAFVNANPFHSPYDIYGNMPKFLDAETVLTSQLTLGARANPLYNAALFSFNDTETITFTNNTNINWQITPALRVEGNLSLQHSAIDNAAFQDPRDTKFANESHTKSGKYTEKGDNSFRYSANARINYGLNINKVHNITFVGRTAIEEQTREGSSFSAMGFPLGARPVPSFAYSYEENARPNFSHSRSRSASFVMAAHYNYNLRYLFDFNLNREGSNTFGSNHLFATVWSVGTGWNIQREAFIQHWDWLGEFRLRGNYGTSANQSGQFLTTDVYGFYPGSGVFGTAAVRNGIGNPHLRWRIVESLSGGIDIAFNNPQLKIILDGYRRISDPLVIRVPQKASSGVGGFPMNFGVMETVGYEFNLTYSPIYNVQNRTILTINLTGGNNRSTYNGFGGLMEYLNNELLTHDDATIANMLQRWEDGSSPDDMWAVPSVGIDPMTGKEIFLKKDGTHTFLFDPSDRVKIANSRPNIEGAIGASMTYKHLRANFALRYRLGAHTFNAALFNKVENISRDKLRDNQDRRALYDRWQTAGDISQFRGINLTDKTEMSSRFIQKINQLTGESVNITWDFQKDGWITNLGLQSLNTGVSMRDIFYLSNVKEERGIAFPFARQVTLNINATF